MKIYRKTFEGSSWAITTTGVETLTQDANLITRDGLSGLPGWSWYFLESHYQSVGHHGGPTFVSYSSSDAFELLLKKWVPVTAVCRFWARIPSCTFVQRGRHWSYASCTAQMWCSSMAPGGRTRWRPWLFCLSSIFFEEAGLGILCIACSQWHRRYCCRSLRRCIAYILRAGCIETSSLRTLRWTVHVWRRWILQKIEGKSQETNPKGNFIFQSSIFQGELLISQRVAVPCFFGMAMAYIFQGAFCSWFKKIRHVRETS